VYVVSQNPLCFLAGCRRRRLNQGLVVALCSFSLLDRACFCHIYGCMLCLVRYRFVISSSTVRNWLPGKIRPRNDLLCVECDVKPAPLNSTQALLKLRIFTQCTVFFLLQLFCVIFLCSLMAFDRQEIKVLLTYLLTFQGHGFKVQGYIRRLSKMRFCGESIDGHWMQCGLVMRKLSVRLSVRLSNAWIVTKRKKNLFRFLYRRPTN